MTKKANFANNTLNINTLKCNIHTHSYMEAHFINAYSYSSY